MKVLKSKLPCAGVLVAESSLVSAHTGGHDMSSWYHYLASPDHAFVLIALASTGLAMSVWLVRNAASKSS